MTNSWSFAWQPSGIAEALQLEDGETDLPVQGLGWGERRDLSHPVPFSFGRSGRRTGIRDNRRSQSKIRRGIRTISSGIIFMVYSGGIFAARNTSIPFHRQCQV